MSLYRTFFLCFLGAMLMAGAASAQILDEKAGADFNYVYTGADLTTSADWTANGTMGTLAVEGTQLRFTASETAGGYYSWANALNHEAGWTMELTFQITQPSVIENSQPFGIIACDGTAGQYNVFLVSSAGVQLRDTSTLNIPVDFTDAMHTLRYAEPAEGGTGDTALWIDGTLYKDNLSGYGSYDLVRVLLGEFSGTQKDGEILIDSYAIDTTGAWAPIGQVIPQAPSPEALTEGSSDAFDYKYEMDVDPSDVAKIDLDQNSMPDFYIVQEGDSTYEFTPEGTWHVTSPNEGDQCFMDGGIYFDTTLWNAGSFTAEEGVTVEVRMKALSTMEEATQTCSIAIAPEDSNEVGAMAVNVDNTRLLGSHDVETDNSDDFHVFRIVRDEKTISDSYSEPAYWMWRDGVLLTEEPAPSIWGGVRDALYFGDMSGGLGGEFEIDYIRFTSGMIAPEGWTYPVSDDLPGDLNGDGLVGSADLDIVRANWGATVEAGCLDCGDPSGDGVVGSADLDIVRANWGATAAAAVPEPGTLMLIAFGLIAVLVRRR